MSALKFSVSSLSFMFMTLIGGLACSLSTASAADAPKADLVNRQQLRVCSDPADLPFSNQAGEGFENKIAAIIGDELKLPVENTWFPKSQGFVRMTLFAKKCDLVVGWGQGDDMLLNTNHIYRSVSVLIVKPGSGLEDVTTLSDPRLKDKTFGVIAGTPPANYLAKYGLMSKAKSYRLMIDRRYDSPGEEMMKDIRAGVIDVGVEWGPIGAYWASRGGEKLKVIPLLKESGGPKLAYRITMGVRQGDDAWKRRLNEIILKRQGDIDAVLLDYGVPLLVDDDASMEQFTAPRKSADASTTSGAAPATP